jgi:hypothetical protein
MKGLGDHFRPRADDAAEQPSPLIDVGFREVPLPSFNLMGYHDGPGEDAVDHLFVHELGVAYDSPGGLSVAARRPKDQAALERLVPRDEWC